MAERASTLNTVYTLAAEDSLAHAMYRLSNLCRPTKQRLPVLTVYGIAADGGMVVVSFDFPLIYFPGVACYFIVIQINNNHVGIGMDCNGLADMLIGYRVEGVVELDPPGLLNLGLRNIDDAPPTQREILQGTLLLLLEDVRRGVSQAPDGPPGGYLVAPFFQSLLQALGMRNRMTFLPFGLAVAGPEVTLGVFHVAFHPALVLRFPGQSGTDEKTVVNRHLHEGAVDFGIGEGSLDDRTLHVVRHHLDRDTAEKLKGIDQG